MLPKPKLLLIYSDLCQELLYPRQEVAQRFVIDGLVGDSVANLRLGQN